MPRFLVRTFLLAAALARVAGFAATVGAPQEVSDLQQNQRVERGLAFLSHLFDRELNLMPEFSSSKTYWLFHDNYLAARVLANTRREMSEQIQAALVKFGVTNSGKIEILFNEARQALPFRNFTLTNVALVNGKTIRTEAVTTNILKGWEQYADLLLLAAIAQARSTPAKARSSFDSAAAMWDGHGFKDRAAKQMGTYSTYKLALYLIAADRLAITPPERSAVLSSLLAMQSSDGGWITDYRGDQPTGQANVETTCLAILALQPKAQHTR
jgi:hypothetical protein